MARLEKLKEYGEEPTQFYNLLKPVVSRFVASFIDPTSDDTISFWQRIAHYARRGSGPSYYSGWITAFCFWDIDGKSMYHMGRDPQNFARFASKDRPHYLELDNSIYHWIESNDVPPGYTSVPVKVDDNGDIFQARMIAGSVGMKFSSSQGAGHDPDTIQPESGWWMFEEGTAAAEVEKEVVNGSDRSIIRDGKSGISKRWTKSIRSISCGFCA